MKRSIVQLNICPREVLLRFNWPMHTLPYLQLLWQPICKSSGSNEGMEHNRIDLELSLVLQIVLVLVLFLYQIVNYVCSGSSRPNLAIFRLL